jgi:molybdopterin-guanine dinucleotide biosynthesis protein A
VSSVVLAGGKARRLGGAVKGRLEVGGVPIIDRITTCLARLCDEIVIVANDPEPYDGWSGRLYPDIVPGKGSLGGIYTALTVARTERVFVCACDMPFVSLELVKHLAARLGEHDAAIPHDGARLQPLHGIFRRRVLPTLEAMVKADDLKIERFVDRIEALICGPDELPTFGTPLEIVFFNVNTAEDLAEANRWADRVG